MVGQRSLLGATQRAGDRRRSHRSFGGAAIEVCGTSRCMSWIVLKPGPKPALVRALGATYHSGSVLDLDFEPDIIVECTGVGSVIVDAIEKIGAGGIICLTGVGAWRYGQPGGR